MRTPLISVVIPVYNVEDYIKECLESIKNQTIGAHNIELIVVDDCSPDKSIDIAKQYLNDFYDLKIIHHQKNLGQGEARNTGLQHITGSYISFIDPDDKISSNVYEHALKCFNEYNCDIVLYEYEYFSRSGKTYARNPSAALFTHDRLITDILDAPEIIFATSVCNKVFTREMAKYLHFPNSKYEDVIASANTTFRAEKIYITNKCKYYYRKREDNSSTMDNYLMRKQNYFDHLSINWSLKELGKDFPRYRELVHWFNARSFSPFLFGLSMRKNKMLNKTEKMQIFYSAKELYCDTNQTILGKLEDPFMAQIIKLAQKHDYRSFMIFVNIEKVIMRASKVKGVLFDNIARLFRKAYKAAELILLYCLSYIFRLIPRYRNVWLVCERGYDARDNGYHFFKYLRMKHPKINAYYLISKDNMLDYNRVSKFGNVLKYKGIKHKTLFIYARCVITAHKGTIEPWNYEKFRRYVNKKQKYIFLQHGITKDDVGNILGRENTSFDLFITGALPEYEYIRNTFGYEEHEVVYTGFPRFDHLQDQSKGKRIILLMPTWRNGIVQKSWNKDEIVSDDVFLSSEYYTRYQSLLRNRSLIELLEIYDYQLIFYPHNEVQQYLKYFKSDSCRVIIASRERYDVQELLLISNLLITDYSSVFFDFGYLEKPILYYQFDQERFFTTHYKKGYFDYKEHGFGPVTDSEEEIVRQIRKFMDRGMQLEDKYKERIQAFFPMRDTRNCERVYNEINRIL